MSIAKVAKKDEFYTQLPDIVNELQHYTEHFRGATIFCNCDDPYESNFFKYFALNFNRLGLKKLICTCYDGSPITGTELDMFAREGMAAEPQKERRAYKIVLTDVRDMNGDGAEDMEDVKIILQQNPPELLKGSGDFRSAECVALLQEADIVVTNPPFSLFREYVAQLVEYNKRFLIIGPFNAITYKEIFPLIKDNKMWLGYGFSGGNAFFKTTSTEGYAKGVYNPETGLVKFRNCTWFTNLDHNKRHEPLDLWKTYNAQDYPKYDNYDAIEAGSVANIPCDYDGEMGVPITFMDKYCPEQFEIIGEMVSTTYDEYNFGYPLVDGKKKYARILIKKKQ